MIFRYNFSAFNPENRKQQGPLLKILSAILVAIPPVALLVLFFSFKDHLNPIITMLFGIATPGFLLTFLLFSGLKESIAPKKE